MVELLEKLAREWAVIASAPLSFAIAIVVIIGVIWVLMHWRYESVLSSKDSEIKLLERQRDDYRDKLHGASPDEAKARIDALEAQLNTFIESNAPRTLSQRQRDVIVKNGRPSDEAKVVVGYDMGAPDGNRYEVHERFTSNS